jgi:hypothetical protein
MMELEDPRRVLHQAVRGNRTLGVVMIFLGADFCLRLGSDFLRRPTLEGRVLVVSFSIFLLAPGVLYLYAAFAMKKREQRAARISLCTTICQSVPSLLAALIALHFGVRLLNSRLYLIGAPRLVSALITPLLVGAFFVPALLVQTWKLSRAMKAIRLLPSTGRAFEAIAVRPVEMIHAPELLEPTHTQLPPPPPPP